MIASLLSCIEKLVMLCMDNKLVSIATYRCLSKCCMCVLYGLVFYTYKVTMDKSFVMVCLLRLFGMS